MVHITLKSIDNIISLSNLGVEVIYFTNKKYKDINSDGILQVQWIETI